jgi:hypothetical protein
MLLPRRGGHALAIGWQESHGFVALFTDEEGATDPVSESALGELLKALNQAGLLMLILKASETPLILSTWTTCRRRSASRLRVCCQP